MTTKAEKRAYDQARYADAAIRTRKLAQNKTWRLNNLVEAKSQRRNRYKVHGASERAQQKIYREAHVDQVKAQQDAWHAANRERHRATSKAWRAANSERAKARDRAYHQTHLKENRTRARQWQIDNPDRVRANIENRRARLAGAKGFHTAEDTAAIRRAQGNRCAYCRERLGRKAHLDHIRALINGGSNWPRNLQWLCIPCNLSKGARDEIEFARSKGLLL